MTMVFKVTFKIANPMFHSIQEVEYEVKSKFDELDDIHDLEVESDE